MDRWKLIFEYDGTHFSGWQKQPEGRTVEGVIEEAFSTLYQTEIDIIGQGRTDAGVHARAQTAHTDLPGGFEEHRILHAMRGLLPQDVALLRAEKTAPDFHARFDAISRSYCYRVSGRQMPLNRHSVWVYGAAFDEQLLNTSAGLITGEHNFMNFCIPPEEEHATTICSVSRSEWKREEELWIYRVEANRFLRHMVRRLVGTMVKVADGSVTMETFKKLLSAVPVQRKGHAAPAHGLILEKVDYV
ncbi:MAG: tRNA pseudouridine(38-40) synthase TruA [Balneolaceae bacterium]